MGGFCDRIKRDRKEYFVVEGVLSKLNRSVFLIMIELNSTTKIIVIRKNVMIRLEIYLQEV